MIFKNVQASMPFYVFNRNDITLSTGKVTGVVPSHVDMTSAKMVVDITAQVNDKTQTYTIEDSLSVAYFGNNAVALERDTILRDIEAMKMNSEQVLHDIDHHKEVVLKCNQLLTENNPTLKEKKETEERFLNLENKIDKILAMFKK